MVMQKQVKGLFFRGLIAGLISGCILGFADLYLGALFGETSVRTYISFFIAYILLCMLIGIIIAMIMKIFFKSKESLVYYYGIFFVCLFLLYDFVIINGKLNGNLNFFHFKAIALNLGFLLAIVTLTIIILKVEQVRDRFSDIWEYSIISILVFNLTASLNYFLLNWPYPPKSKVTILEMLFFILTIPFLVIAIISSFEKLLSLFIKSQIVKKVYKLSLAVLIVMFIPLIVRYPSLSFYENARYRPNKNQLEKLKGKPNLIWIVLDAARSDHFSCYGYDRKTTPNIDGFSKDGVLFTNYISTAPWTLPSHASMFTGMYSSKHGAYLTDNTVLGAPLAKESLTLAEALRNQGFNTGAVVANFIAMHKGKQLDQGFNFYYCPRPQFENFFWGMIVRHARIRKFVNIWFLGINVYSLSSEINNIVLHWLSKNEKHPFFLFINYMEPHSGASYLPGSFDSLYGFSREKWHRYSPKPEYLKKIVLNKKTITPEQLQIQYDWLDCKLTYLDYQIGKLLDKLKEMNLYDNSIIIIVSDHGTLFGEYNILGHGGGLYNELIRVPLIIKYPSKMNFWGVIDKYVQTVDLMPEVLTILKVPLPKGVQGQPISEANHKIVSELFRWKNHYLTKINPARFYRDLKAIYSSDGYKYIQSSNMDSELYNLADDPNEHNNIVSQMHPKSQKLDQELTDWRQSFSPLKRLEVNQGQMSEDLQDNLRALGYVQ